MNLSIITIGRNNAEGLKRTLDSVAFQTCHDFEHIIIDGASNDQSVSLVKEYEKCVINENRYFISWLSEPDNGIYDAMNKGIAMAKGEYLLFLNSGDVLATDTVIEEWLKYNATADIVACNSIFEASNYHDEKYIISPQTIKASDLILSFLPHQATFIRRQLFHDIHLYDTTFKVISDWLFFIEAILVHNASYQHIQMFVSRCETEGISSDPKNNQLMDDEFHAGLKKVLPLYYDDYVELRGKRRKEQIEKQIFFEKLSKSWLGKLLWAIKKQVTRIGYYKIKSRISKKRFYKKLQREDKTKKQQVAKEIESLSLNMLQRNNDESDIIVSLTSYGKRVEDTAPYAIYSIFTQSKLPNRIVLWLDNENWNDDNLPYLLKRLKKSGLEIYYCEDLRSYKKLLPSLQMFPNNPIVVIDDDFYYHKDFIKWMTDALNNSDGHTVFATWGCIPEKRNRKYIPYSQWKDCKFGDNYSEYSLYGGGGGYPPNAFDDEIFRKDIYMSLCPTADDLWFWIQEKRMGVKTCLTPNHGYGLHIPVNRIEEYDITQQGTLFYQNCVQGKNDEQLTALLKHYFPSEV